VSDETWTVKASAGASGDTFEFSWIGGRRGYLWIGLNDQYLGALSPRMARRLMEKLQRWSVTHELAAQHPRGNSLRPTSTGSLPFLRARRNQKCST
jgi:hypothetical protein